MPTCVSAAMARSRAVAPSTSSWARIASIIWVSTRSTGFSVIVGSWNTMAMFRPSSARSRSGDARARSSPR
jgi:hypothetical protein